MADDFSDLSEEQIQQLMDLGIIDDEQSILDKQLKTANSVRYSAGPEMRSNGRVSTAANPLEFAVHAYQGYKAGKDADAIAKQQQELLKRQVEARAAYTKNLYGRSNPGGLGPMPSRDEGIL